MKQGKRTIENDGDPVIINTDERSLRITDSESLIIIEGVDQVHAFISALCVLAEVSVTSNGTVVPKTAE